MSRTQEFRPQEVTALVPAAGSGTRLGLGPKAFLELSGETLLRRAVKLLVNYVGRILVAAPYAEIDRARFEVGSAAEVYPGETTRQGNVRSLFSKCTGGLVVIHDPTHPFVTKELLVQVIELAHRKGAAIALLQPDKPVAHYRDGIVTQSIPSSKIGMHQSPQAFHRGILDRAFRKAAQTGTEAQATWELVAMIGIPVHTVPGDETNIKITTRFDWEVAKKVIAPRFPSVSSNEG